MCGITGFYSERGYSEEVLYPMMERIRHRGPDDSGTFFHNNHALGHQRLAIIDIANAKQPMQTPDGRYTIIFNGEIYNYLELRQKLVQDGESFSTHSDTEVLLKLYANYGKECLAYLNGMFAFAVLDRQTDTMFLARDHFGIKPLYYYEGSESFVFASEIKSILAHPEVEAEANESAVSQYLTYQLMMNGDTLFKDIQALEPASYMIVEKGKVKEKKEFWRLDFVVDYDKSEDEFASELLVLLENSLSIQMRSDVPVGSYLSGGLDSSTVAVLAAKSFPGSISTFSGGFHESPLYDETHYARIVSDKIQSRHFEIWPEHTDFERDFEKLVYHMDFPVAGPGVFPQYMVSKLASENVKVVLGGQGGDELFGGYARYIVAYLEQCLKGAINGTQDGYYVVTLKTIVDSLPMLKQYMPMIKQQFGSGLFEEMDRRYYALVNRSPNLHKVYDEGFLEGVDSEAMFGLFSDIFNREGLGSYFNRMTYFDTKTLLPGLLQVEDRMSMAVSLESRVPLLDYRIAEMAAKMPPLFKFNNGKAKSILLKAVKNLLPNEIVERKDKMGFPTPISEWFTGPLREYVMDILTGETAKRRGIINTEAVEEQLNASNRFSRDLWGALNLELWYRTFIDG
ncbi:asparagine synthase (glutamine-hydrolyzing) [Limisalsivibrio acetivorans]|uniref:asparagine synthase (glutamine-hydrolyzing) n=1 Tax=Limisalsivibrio acetivorans TaxID=1304888 RepID=UPI0003B4647F|nr:asparagine synthase (glutamine-hydrolyzing) [Limisalsivibrio acetivorans]